MQNERDLTEPEPAEPEPAGQALAERVRAALIECALEAYADAGVRGLCAEGAWEATVAALRKLDLGALYHQTACPPAAEPGARAELPR